jgi:hypothetical protein
MIECPQCGTSNDDGAKNCASCRINLYWAAHHYAELVQLRQAGGLVPRPDTAPFLLETSQRVDNGPVAGWLRRAIEKARF